MRHAADHITVKAAVKEAARTQSATVITAAFIILAYVAGVWTGGSTNPGYFCEIFDNLAPHADSKGP